MPENINFSMEYFVSNRIYTDEGDTKKLQHGLPTCTEDNRLAKARGIFSRTGGQTMVYGIYTGILLSKSNNNLKKKMNDAIY